MARQRQKNPFPDSQDLSGSSASSGKDTKNDPLAQMTAVDPNSQQNSGRIRVAIYQDWECLFLPDFRDFV